MKIALVTAVLVACLARPASAQLAEPFGGRAAIGAQFGGAVPIGPRLDNGSYGGASLLLTMASHAALNIEAGANRVAVDRPGFASHLMPRFADVDLLVTLRRGPFRPFVMGGVGVYRYTITVSNDAFSDASLRAQLLALGLAPASARAPIEVRHDELGANLGGGFEYFFSRRSAIVMDTRLHAGRNFVAVAPFESVFVDAAVGFRQYF